MKIEEIKKSYPEQWVLAKVLKENRLGEVTEAEPLVVSQNRDEVYEAVSHVPAGEHVVSLFTGKILKDGEAFSFASNTP